MSRVLIYAAHPDDEVLGVGGTAEKHKAAGDYVTTVVHFKCRIDPAPGVYWDMAEPGQLRKELIESTIALLKPEIVYTHHDGDINADHRALAEAVLVACRPYAAPSVRSLRMFETPSSTEWGTPFVPNLFVDISQHLNGKLDALVPYDSELRPFPHPRGMDSLRYRAAYWGSISGMDFAEPFRVVRETW